jgi:hypothetical protein
MGAKDLDRQLRASRKAPRVNTNIATLPEGVFVSVGDNDFRLVWNGALHRWSPEGYIESIAISDAPVMEATVLTPPLSVAALRHGYPLGVHPSAR